MNTTIVISSSPATLSAMLFGVAICGKTSATVEAEYGDVTVRGAVATLAHHGANKGNLCPCLHEGVLSPDVIGVSHLDLDTIGGIWGLVGNKPVSPGFWELAAFVDVNGAHKLGEVAANEQDVARLYAWWAYNEKNKTFPPRDGSVMDCTQAVMLAFCALESILRDDAEMLAIGAAFRAAEDKLEVASFVERIGEVIVRSSDNFVNHLYVHGEASSAVVGYSTKYKSITVSFASPRHNDDACAFVQSLWGSLAGGHQGIAGSPRGTEYTLEDAIEVARKLASTF